MMTFQKKVTALRAYESAVYTICLSILTDDKMACDTAKQLLIDLFKDSDFWMKEEQDRQAYISRICISRCFPLTMHMHAAATSSFVS